MKVLGKKQTPKNEENKAKNWNTKLNYHGTIRTTPWVRETQCS